MPFLQVLLVFLLEVLLNLVVEDFYWNLPVLLGRLRWLRQPRDTKKIILLIFRVLHKNLLFA